MHRLKVPARDPGIRNAPVKLGPCLSAFPLLTCLFSIALVAAGCGQSGAVTSASPLPDLTPLEQPAASGGQQLQAGIGRSRDVYFRSKGGSQGVVIRALRAVWRESLVASDGTTHERVLAVALQVINSGPTPLGKLRTMGELELSDGVTRRSGRFSVAHQLGAADQHARVARGWLVFENVDWDALRGNSSPSDSRFRLRVMLSDGAGTGEWYVDADPGQQGASRLVHLPGLGASVNYMLN